jgi:hypothetical protein
MLDDWSAYFVLVVPLIIVTVMILFRLIGLPVTVLDLSVAFAGILFLYRGEYL